MDQPKSVCIVWWQNILYLKLENLCTVYYINYPVTHTRTELILTNDDVIISLL